MPNDILCEIVKNTNELKIIVHPRDEYNINPYSEESFKTRNTKR